MSLLNAARSPAITGGPEMMVAEACDIMIKEHVAAIAVVEGGKLTGIFTERDLTKKMVPKRLDPNSTKLAEIMTDNPLTITRDRPFNEALSFMLEHKIRHLPIVDDSGMILGMLSLRSMLMRQIEDMDNAMEGVAAYMGADGPGG